MEERWLTVAYCAHGLFCDCKNPKKHLEKCLTDAIADAEGDRHGDGGTGGGDATFDIGIDALLAAAAQSGEDMAPKDLKQPSEIPAPYHVPLNPGNGTTTGYKTPPRYKTQSSTLGTMTVTGLLEQILSKDFSNSPQRRRRRRRRTHSLDKKQRKSHYQTPTKRALSQARAVDPLKKKRRRDESTTSQASDDSSSTSSGW
uniref:ORF2/2 protein n=1 Tax=Torque teno sus virus 1b TaxID=687387 RepID=D3YFW1_9VIRU|nr:ORF2/2 protein [Torque teno sus virus 1b]